jgi:hypothetical protein
MNKKVNFGERFFTIFLTKQREVLELLKFFSAESIKEYHEEFDFDEDMLKALAKQHLYHTLQHIIDILKKERYFDKEQFLDVLGMYIDEDF